MSNYSQRMADLLLADYARWQDRQNAENAPLADSRAALASYHGERSILRGIGMVSPPAKYPNRKPRTRVVGVAAPAPDSAAIARLASGDVNATMRVIRNGIETIVEVNSRGRATSHKPRTVVTQTEHRTTAADLPANIVD